MPDSFGKRQRDAKKARKFAEREERRAIRKRQKAGLEPSSSDEEAPDESPEGEGEPVAGKEPGPSEVGA